jgi:hypothetical protein
VVIKIGKINVVGGISGYGLWTAQPRILSGSAITAEIETPAASYYCRRAIGRIDPDDTTRLKLRSQEISFPIDRKAGDFFQLAFRLERCDDSASKIDTPDDILVFGDVKGPGAVDGKRLRIAKLCLHSRPRVPRPIDYLAAANLDERHPRSQQNGKRAGQLHVPMLTRNINPGKQAECNRFRRRNRRAQRVGPEEPGGHALRGVVTRKPRSPLEP